MTKLTAPAPQNRTKRKKFFEDHPEFPNAKVELEKISKQDKAIQIKIAIIICF